MDILQAVTRSLQVRPVESNAIQLSNNQPTYIKEKLGKEDIKGINEPIIVSEISKEELEKSVEKANQFLLGLNIQFDFKVHEATGRTVVRLVDKQTEDVVKEIPPEKMLDVIAGIWEAAGILVDRKE